MIGPEMTETSTSTPVEAQDYYARRLEPGIGIATIGLQHTVELPAGYEYATELAATNVVALFRGHYPGSRRFSGAVWLGGQAKQAHAGLSGIHVAVNEAAGELVGMGKLVYMEAQGCMADFVVHTDHRSRGVGKAIIDEQLSLATALGLTMIKIPRLESTNTLLTYYLDKGFVQTDDSGLELQLADVAN